MIEFSIWDNPKLQLGFPSGLNGKESACNAGGPGSFPGSGRSPVEGNGYPLQFSCLENSMDRGAWQAMVHAVAKSQARPSDYHFYFQAGYPKADTLRLSARVAEPRLGYTWLCMGPAAQAFNTPLPVSELSLSCEMGVVGQ